jgi:hypothetical protein
MGFRFRRSIKIAPGVRINLSKSGVSTSIGTRGAHVTVGHGKVRETVGIPGTGLSYTEVHGAQAQNEGEQLKQHTVPLATLGNLVYLAFVLGIVFLLGYACGAIIR